MERRLFKISTLWQDDVDDDDEFYVDVDHQSPPRPCQPKAGFGLVIMTTTMMTIFVVMMVAVKAVAGTRLVGLKEVTTPGAADTAALCVHHL